MDEINDLDWKTVMKRIVELQSKNNELREKAKSDAEIIRELSDKISYLSGEVAALKYCLKGEPQC